MATKITYAHAAFLDLLWVFYLCMKEKMRIKIANFRTALRCLFEIAVNEGDKFKAYMMTNIRFQIDYGEKLDYNNLWV